MKKVFLSKYAEHVIDNYFEHYQWTDYGTDMPQRAFNYSRILNFLFHIDVYWNDVYSHSGKNFIDIDGICTVEFAKNENVIMIENVIFNS
ncbi:MAG: hypothetical protein FWC39_05890 [Bacteroidetes bacterium]|nr:hypothetical protein [Bacteroidota bacterium]